MPFFFNFPIYFVIYIHCARTELISMIWRTSCHFYRLDYFTCWPIQSQWLQSYWSVWRQLHGIFLWKKIALIQNQFILMWLIWLFFFSFADFFTLLSMLYTWSLNRLGRFVSLFISQSLSTWQLCASFILFKITVELFFESTMRKESNTYYNAIRIGFTAQNTINWIIYNTSWYWFSIWFNHTRMIALLCNIENIWNILRYCKYSNIIIFWAVVWVYFRQND